MPGNSGEKVKFFFPQGALFRISDNIRIQHFDIPMTSLSSDNKKIKIKRSNVHSERCNMVRN